MLPQNWGKAWSASNVIYLDLRIVVTESQTGQGFNLQWTSATGQHTAGCRQDDPYYIGLSRYVELGVNMLDGPADGALGSVDSGGDVPDGSASGQGRGDPALRRREPQDDGNSFGVE